MLASPGGRCSHRRENSGAYNGSDAQKCKLHGTQFATELMLGHTRFADEGIERFASKKVGQRHGLGVMKSGWHTHKRGNKPSPGKKKDRNRKNTKKKPGGTEDFETRPRQPDDPHTITIGGPGELPAWRKAGKRTKLCSEPA